MVNPTQGAGKIPASPSPVPVPTSNSKRQREESEENQPAKRMRLEKENDTSQKALEILKELKNTVTELNQKLTSIQDRLAIIEENQNTLMKRRVRQSSREGSTVLNFGNASSPSLVNIQTPTPTPTPWNLLSFPPTPPCILRVPNTSFYPPTRHFPPIAGLAPTPTNTPTNATPMPPESYVIRVEQLLEQFVFKTALQVTRDGLNAFPGNLQLLLLLAKIYLNQSKYDKALPVINEALSKDSTNASALNIRATIYLKQNQLEFAAADFREAIKGIEDKSSMLYQQGLIYQQCRLFDEAIDSFNQALVYNPQQAKALIAQVVVWYLKHDSLQAKLHLEKAEDLLTNLTESFEKNALKSYLDNLKKKMDEKVQDISMFEKSKILLEKK